MPRIWTCSAALVLVFLAGSSTAEAATCTISTISVSFGIYDVFNMGPHDSTGTLTYRCGPPGSPASNVTVVLTQGQGGAFNPRRMNAGAQTLTYNLYLDAARTTIWGDGSGGTSVYFAATAPHNTNVTLTIYGRIPARQDVAAGSYTDTVLAIINW